MTQQAILFDLDGVLIDSKEVWFSLMNSTASHFGHPEVTRERMKEVWGSGVSEDADALFPGTTVAQVEAYYNAHFMDYVDQIIVTPNAGQVMERLTQEGIKYAVVTNTPHEAARKILDSAKLIAPVVVGGTDAPRPKPAPDMLLLAMELLAVQPENAIMVGDTRYDREAAQAAGVRFAGFGIEGDVTLQNLEELFQHLRS